MATIVIGGHSRSVGKTSVVAGLIGALPERNWTAVKITQYGHGICSDHGGACECAVDDQAHSFAINEEKDRSGDSDTSRFLVAGAREVLWVRTRQGCLSEAIPDLFRRLESAQNVILESNSILEFLSPNLYISVLDFATKDFKESAKVFLGRADALILHDSPSWSKRLVPQWPDISLVSLGKLPTFRVCPPNYVNADLVEFVEKRLWPRCGGAPARTHASVMHR